jgi:hypothetical protein
LDWPGGALSSVGGFSAFGFGARILSTFTFGAFSSFGSGTRTFMSFAFGAGRAAFGLGPCAPSGRAASGFAPFPRSALTCGAAGRSCLPRRRFALCRP